jgi:hypothetical protein
VITLIWIVIALGIGLWIGKRLGPALIAMAITITAPIWLIFGFILDQIKKITPRNILAAKKKAPHMSKKEPENAKK